MKPTLVLLCWAILGASFPLHAEDAFPAPSGRKAEEKTSPTTKPTPDQEPAPYIASLDTFGSSRISEPKLRKLLGPDLDAWLKAGVTGDPEADNLQKKITKKVVDTYKFPFAEWSIMQYMEPGNLAIRVTLDVVEKQDVTKRMPFLKKPTETIPEPKQLVTKWYEYQETALKLADEGSLEQQKIDCEGAFHCLFGHQHAQLKPFGELFKKEVEANKKDLIAILTRDKDGDKRAAAAFLLAYLKDPNELISLMVERIQDPDALVRNNALRVLGDIAEFHPNLDIPLKPILPVLEYPLVTDRSKAVYLIFAILNRPDDKSETAKAAAIKNFFPILALLKSQQPNQSGPAYAVLRRISNEHFAPNEIPKWEKWFERLPAGKK